MPLSIKNILDEKGRKKSQETGPIGIKFLATWTQSTWDLEKKIQSLFLVLFLVFFYSNLFICMISSEEEERLQLTDFLISFVAL